MKKILNIHSFFFVLLSVFIITSSFAQKEKKDKVRLKAYYVKIMNSEVYFDLQASARVDGENVDVSKVELVIFNIVDDEQLELGKVTTNAVGKARFTLKDLSSIKPDSTNTYNIEISFGGNESFKGASKSISFKNADIKATVISKDSINYVTATLLDTASESPITEESLKVQVKRLFRSLPIGENFNYTDENGTILVPIEEGIPGVDGILTFEVVLSDNDDYGTVKAIVKAPVGIPIVEETTFNDRTMWSPRNKTPLFLLIFPNLLILSIWGLFIYLIINLFKISKS
tara:strand:- start:622 stop:1482 length:861 start_codon:yes stop_codon:yes gene_type:complete